LWRIFATWWQRKRGCKRPQKIFLEIFDPIAKFGLALLLKIVTPPTSQNWEIKKNALPAAWYGNK
jgi:hypothetical protein